MPHPCYFILFSTAQGQMANIRVTLRSGEELREECERRLWLWALILLQSYQDCKMAQLTAVGHQVDRWSAHSPETHP